VNVMCLVMPAAACLLILDSLRTIIIAQWAQWSPHYKMWNHSIMYAGRYQHQSFWNKGLISSTAKVSGFWQYQLHVKGIMLCFWSFLNVLKVELWFVIGDLNFPREQWFSSAREWYFMYQFKWPLCKKKCAVGCSMMLQSQRW
jgi:hypothetical protein